MTDHPFLQRIADRLAALADEACPGVARPGLLVGLSGGPDSVALLLAAVRWAQETGNPLEAVHLDHRLREGDSEADARFCRDLCARLDLRLHEFSRDPRPLARDRGRGLEEAARHLRGEIFAEVLAAHGHLHCVATGHHRDDQAETVLIRLFRGTGPDGLLGMRPVSGRHLRPLLDVSRTEILGMLESCGQPWRRDASNLDGDNLRARIRRELVPLLGSIFGEGSHGNPVRAMDLLAADLDFLGALTRAALTEAMDSGGLSASRLLGMEPVLAGRVLKEWLDSWSDGPGADPGDGGRIPDGIARSHVDAVLSWLRRGTSGTGLDLPGGLTVRRDLDRVTARRAAHPAPVRQAADYRILVENGPATADPAALGRREDSGLALGNDSWRLTCPSVSLKGNLSVRNPRPGDRFQPFGLEGSKKLSDLLLEKRVPADERAGVLVVADEDGILWVVGVARAERTRLLPSTDKIVTICVARRSQPQNRGN